MGNRLGFRTMQSHFRAAAIIALLASSIALPASALAQNPPPAATEADLVAWAKERSANFRVPRYLRIVQDFEAIGMTASGKVQKAKLREHALKEFRLA